MNAVAAKHRVGREGLMAAVIGLAIVGSTAVPLTAAQDMEFL